MMPGLSDLHRHLDGSLRPDTLVELARDAGVTVPADLCFVPGMGLQEALSRFAFMLNLLQQPDTVCRVAAEMCEDAKAEGVTTLEIRFAPHLHRGADISTVVDAALVGINGRAGLILCALYGDPPDLVEALVDAARPGVVGLDLAGGPHPTHRHGMHDYAPAFQRAARCGLGRTVHAGEGRPAQEIHDAIALLGAQRIGHGSTVLDNAEVVKLVVDRQITIEACPTSNWHTGVISRVEDHPIDAWLRAGIPVCLNADNTLLSSTSSLLEHQKMAGKLSNASLEQVIANGHSAAFRR